MTTSTTPDSGDKNTRARKPRVNRRKDDSQIKSEQKRIRRPRVHKENDEGQKRIRRNKVTKPLEEQVSKQEIKEERKAEPKQQQRKVRARKQEDKKPADSPKRNQVKTTKSHSRKQENKKPPSSSGSQIAGKLFSSMPKNLDITKTAQSVMLPIAALQVKNHLFSFISNLFKRGAQFKLPIGKSTQEAQEETVSVSFIPEESVIAFTAVNKIQTDALMKMTKKDLIDILYSLQERYEIQVKSRAAYSLRCRDLEDELIDTQKKSKFKQAATFSLGLLLGILLL